MIRLFRSAAITLFCGGALAAWSAEPSAEEAAPTARGVERFRTADGALLDVVLRPAPRQPSRYRVIVLPGSGCAGLAPIATAYFRGLAHGDVAVLHKRHADARAWPPPEACPDAFVAADRFSRWFDDADAFITAQAARLPGPLLLIGISEGAELLPLLARAHPDVTHVALLASTGADPLAVYEAQVRRLDRGDEFVETRRLAADRSHGDAERHAGRTLGYWRDLLDWPVAGPLLALDRPVWIAFGALDGALPIDGLRQLADQAAAGRASLCTAVFAGTDHGLAEAAGDRPLQRFLGWLDAAMLRGAGPGDCAPLAGSNHVDPIAP